MKLINENELHLRDSRGYIQGWYSNKQPVTDKPSLDTLLSAYRADPTVRGAIKAISDEVIKNGFRIETKNKTLKSQIEKTLKKDFRFSRLLRKIINNILVYGNVFLEIVYKGDTPKELHVLETTEMQIVSDKHGVVRGYIQRAGAQGEEVTFTTEEVVHISLEHIKSNLWGEVDLQTLYSIINLKQEVEKFMRNLFRYNKFRDSWIIEDASEPQIRDFINNLRIAQDIPEKEIVIQGKITKINGRDIKELDKLIEILNYTRQEILTMLRVPPIIAGIPDNSNRSNSEVQARKAFDTRIKSIQTAVEEEFDSELFPKLGWSVAEFKFNPIDKRAEKDDIEIILALHSMGLDDKSLIQYMKDVGIQLPEGARLEKRTEGTNPFPPSRKPEDKSAPVEHKTGEESETREDQLMGRTEDFNDPEDWGLDQFAEEVLNVK